MFENPRRGKQAKDFTTNVPKILDLKSSSEQIFFRKLSLGAPVSSSHNYKAPYFSAFTLCSKQKNNEILISSLPFCHS